MFVLRPSSPFKTSPPGQKGRPENLTTPADTDLETANAIASAPLDPLAVDAEPFIDLGLPVPETYNADILRAMIQDPFRVFIYWEAREENLQALTTYFSPAEVQSFSTVLKLRDLTGGQEAYFPVGKRGRYWMMVFPNRQYEFEIGVRSPVHGYISLMRSNHVQTPRGTVSPVTADEAEYQLEPADFLDVVEKSGFGAEQALDITLAAMPGADTIDANILEETLRKLGDQTRQTIEVALSGHHLTAEMIASLPESIRELVMGLFERSGGEVAAVGLMHYLPELLRETIEDEREWVTDQTHPMHLSPRFFTGASEMAQVPSGEVTLSKPPRHGRPSSDEMVQKPRLSSGPSLRQLLTDFR